MTEISGGEANPSDRQPGNHVPWRCAAPSGPGRWRCHRTARDYLPELDADGQPIDVSFATQNWQKAVRDRRRPGMLVRRHFEAMAFCYLAEELRAGDVAVIGSEEYADWSKQLLNWETVEAKLPQYLVDVGPHEAARHIPGVTGHELSMAANRHFSIPKLNEAIADVVNAHARLDMSQAWGNGTCPTSTPCAPTPPASASDRTGEERAVRRRAGRSGRALPG